MDNNISTNPITINLLNGSVSLESITLPQFLEGRNIYPTAASAACKGFEAEHIKTVSLQMKEYNKLHGTQYNNRNAFVKEVADFDDRCYRVTPFEHIIMHYLKAKESQDELLVFWRMYNFNNHKLNKLESVTVERCAQLAQLREEARDKISSARKDLLRNMDSEKRLVWIQNAQQGQHTEQGHRNMSEAQKRYRNNLSEERKEELRQQKKCIMSQPEVREKISTSIKQHYASMTLEERNAFCDLRKIARNKPETQRKLSERWKGTKVWNNGEIEIQAKECPEGFTLGKLPSYASPCRGQHYYNNGSTELRAFECPEGFVKGRLPGAMSKAGTKGMRRYTDGINSIMAKECPQGWRPGISRSSDKKSSSK